MSRTTHRHRNPDSPPRVRFSPDHLGPTPRGRPRTATARPEPSRSRSASYSPSRSRSRSRSLGPPPPRVYYEKTRQSPPRHTIPPPSPKDEKHFYQKKTLWTSLATLATVAALLPSAVSAKASVDAAHASTRAAKASEKSAQQVAKSARASELSARAAASSSIAQGHMDEYGRAVRKDGARMPIGVGIVGGRQIGYGGGNARRAVGYGMGW